MHDKYVVLPKVIQMTPSGFTVHVGSIMAWIQLPLDKHVAHTNSVDFFGVHIYNQLRVR